MCGMKQATLMFIAAILFVVAPVGAQNYPAKPVRVITGGRGHFP